MNKILLACMAGITLVGMAACGNQAASSGGTAASAAADVPPVAVTSVQLAKDYEANTVAADEKYKGKKLKITGKVTDIATGITDQPYVVLPGSNQFLGVQLHFDGDAKAQLAKLKKGQQITATCTGNGDVMKIPMNKACVLE